jgi:hypothetical protein
MNIIDYAVSYIVHNTRYTPYQCYRVIELISKYGEKAPYHLTKKQYEIMKMLVYLLGVGQEVIQQGEQTNE